MTDHTRPTVTQEDAARAEGVLLAWRAEGGRPGPVLRGLLLGAFADCRADAYADALLDLRAARTDPDLDPRCDCATD